MADSSDIHWGLNEFGNINRTSLNDYVPWPLWEQILGIAYYFFISLIGIVGNVFIIYAAEKVKKQSSDQKTLLIIKYLALVDLFSSALLYPNFVYFTWVKRFNAHPFYCKILGLWEIYFPTTSTFLVLMLVAVKVDMLRNPFHSLSSSNKWIHVGCILICFAGLIIPAAPFYNLATYIYCPKRMTCTFDFYPDWTNDRPKSIFVTWAVVFCCVAPLLAIAILSYYIIKKVRRSRQAKDGKSTSEKKQSLGKSVRVVLLVVLAYAVTWASFFIVFTVAFFFRTEQIIPRSLLFWPKASLMTNNAVNPIVYIYSNVNIQRFLILKCVPKFIAEKTKIYQEFKKAQQNKIFSTTIVGATPQNRHMMVISQSTTAKTTTSSLNELRPKFRNHMNAKTNSGRTDETSSVETDQTPHSRVTSVQDEVGDDIVNHKNAQNRRSSLLRFARRISLEGNSVKRSKSLEPKLSFTMRYNEFMQCQLEQLAEGEKENVQEEEEEKEEVSSGIADANAIIEPSPKKIENIIEFEGNNHDICDEQS